MSFYKRRRPKQEEEKCADPAKARARALDALASREMSSAQLYERLCYGFTEQAAAAAVAEMVELDYVNDDRYAEARAHSLLAARKSRRAAAQNLRQKGLSGAQIEQALESVYAPDADGESPELEAAAALVRSRYMKKLADGRRDLVVAALQRRGFAYSVIKEAIKKNKKHPSKEKESIIPYENCVYFPWLPQESGRSGCDGAHPAVCRPRDRGRSGRSRCDPCEHLRLYRERQDRSH